jgi:hypothetical protein
LLFQIFFKFSTFVPLRAGAQHVYGESVGKLTRRLHGGATNLDDPTTSYDLLNYKDKRPNYMDGNMPTCL